MMLEDDGSAPLSQKQCIIDLGAELQLGQEVVNMFLFCHLVHFVEQVYTCAASTGFSDQGMSQQISEKLRGCAYLGVDGVNTIEN